MLNESTRSLTHDRLRTPRSAALAGIAFSLLLGASGVLIQLSIPPVPPYDPDWLVKQADRVSLAATLIPFAGIAFLWFIGVIRDQLGEMEDQFFSTVFFGSGLLMLGGLFAWMTIILSVLASFTAAPDTYPSSDAYIFGRSMIKVMGGVVALRMAGVFMFSSGTIWLRTKIMPRWLIWLTYLMALVLLIGGASFRSLRLGFPLWVFVVSLFILRASAQRIDDDEDSNG
jgi:hypothetical protein